MHGSSDHRFRKFKSVLLGRAFVAAPIALALIFCTPKAGATPTFARQTGRNCNFCHSGIPRLNDTGAAFRTMASCFQTATRLPTRITRMPRLDRGFERRVSAGADVVIPRRRPPTPARRRYWARGCPASRVALSDSPGCCKRSTPSLANLPQPESTTEGRWLSSAPPASAACRPSDCRRSGAWPEASSAPPFQLRRCDRPA